jgi:hypothetical protein
MPDYVATFWRRYKATPIGAPVDGLCGGCDRAIFRGDTVRVDKELRVVHWDCWHRDISWRASVSEDLPSPQATVLGAASVKAEGLDH